MINELEPYGQEDWAPQTQPSTGALQRLEAEARAMDTASKIARGLSNTEMVPEHFQQSGKDKNGKLRGETAIWNLAAAILYGAELGMSAAASAQNIFVVKGKPAVYARTMAAQVRRAGYRIEEVEASDTKVVWRAERDGHWVHSEWTIERAKQAGYTANQKYTTNPQEMLRAKCIAEVCRISYQDVLLGMAYSVEELQLDDVTVQRVVKREARGAAALREIAAAAAQAAVAAPDPEPEAAAVTPPEPERVPEDAEGPELATPEQIDTIKKLYKAKGIVGQAVLDDVGQFLQVAGKLSNFQKLTQDDAAAVLTQLLATGTQ